MKISNKKLKLIIVAGIVVIHLKLDNYIITAYKILADLYQITPLQRPKREWHAYNVPVKPNEYTQELRSLLKKAEILEQLLFPIELQKQYIICRHTDLNFRTLVDTANVGSRRL